MPAIARFFQLVIVGMIRVYQWTLGAMLGPTTCRFEPTCSQYALTAVEKHGSVKGGYLTVCRLMRCHPWAAGGADPVPK